MPLNIWWGSIASFEISPNKYCVSWVEINAKQKTFLLIASKQIGSVLDKQKLLKFAKLVTKRLRSLNFAFVTFV